MNEIKQAEIYLRVLWLNDNENLRPDNLNIKLDGETTEEVVFSISKNDNNTGNNVPWETAKWCNGVTYSYQTEPQEVNEEEQIEISNIPYIIPSVINIPTNYRCNILKNVENEEYSYYTIKMTYVSLKSRKMLRNASSTPTLNFSGTTIENVNFNGTEVEKVVFNGTTVFEKANTFDKLILANSTLNEGTPDFSLTATTDEGMFAAEDNDGISYYFRGAVNNNYVKFAGRYWRIVRINGDGSIRLIYDGTTCHANGTSTTDSIAVTSVKYNTSSNQSNYVGWTYEGTKQRPTDYATSISSNAKTQLESWYLSNIGTNATYASKVADGKFCNDRNVGSGYTWGLKPSKKFYYIGPTRLYINKTPSLLCDSDDIYTLKVGLITADEVAYAGGKALFFNNLYYLNNDQNYWTITPAEWNTSSIGDSKIFNLKSNGQLNWVNTNDSSNGLRPVINLQKNIEVTGTGTMEDPYIVVGAE